MTSNAANVLQHTITKGFTVNFYETFLDRALKSIPDGYGISKQYMALLAKIKEYDLESFQGALAERESRRTNMFNMITRDAFREGQLAMVSVGHDASVVLLDTILDVEHTRFIPYIKLACYPPVSYRYVIPLTKIAT